MICVIIVIFYRLIIDLIFLSNNNGTGFFFPPKAFFDAVLYNVVSVTQLSVLFFLQVHPKDLNNGIINAAFMLLFKDLIKLFASYNDGIINLLGTRHLNETSILLCYFSLTSHSKVNKCALGFLCREIFQNEEIGLQGVTWDLQEVSDPSN